MFNASSVTLLGLLIVACGTSYYWGILPHPLTIGGALMGVLISIIFPQYLRATSSWEGIKLSIAGALIGFSIGWATLEIGKMVFGRKELRFDPSVRWGVIQPNEQLPPVIVIGDSQVTWEQVFARSSDRLVMDCNTLQISDDKFDNAQAIISMETVTAKTAHQEQTYDLGNVTKLVGTTTRVQIPREAMGFGVVLLFAMIGAFVGAKEALWVTGGSLILMTSFTGIQFLISRQGGTERLELAPFTLVAYMGFLLLKRFAVL
jgi:leader peptidase (prepilin peptidase) / N-methyltransferase